MSVPTMKPSKIEKSIPTNGNKLMGCTRKPGETGIYDEWDLLILTVNFGWKVLQSHKSTVWLQAHDNRQDSSFMQNSPFACNQHILHAFQVKTKDQIVRVYKQRKSKNLTIVCVKHRKILSILLGICYYRNILFLLQ